MVALLISLVIATKKKMNAGLLAMAFAYIIACVFGDTSINDLIGTFPIYITFVLISTSVFFGYASDNGTLYLLSEKFLYLTRRWKWAPAIMIYIATFIVASAGGGTSATLLLLSPIAFQIAELAGFNPLLVPLAISMASASGDSMPWSAGHATRVAYMTGYFNESEISSLCTKVAVINLLLYIVIYLVYYFFFKGNKTNGFENMEKPKEFNAVQKKTLCILCIVVGILIVPSLLESITGLKIFSIINGKINIQFLSICGAVVCALLGLGEEGNIIKSYIPLSIIILAGGVTMLINVAVNAGLSDVIIGLFSGDIPQFAVYGLLFFVCGVLSFFSGYVVVWPLILPLIPGIAEATGCSMVGLLVAPFIGGMVTGMSPISIGGAMILGGCQNAETRDKIFMPQLIHSIVLTLIVNLLAFTPVVTMFGLW